MSSDRYEIRGKIGQGGVGAVYRAYDTQLRREVAMKRVLQDGELNGEDATANLLKEATALSSVQHPHIVTVYDAGIDAEGPYVVMELINGKTLDEMVERGTLTFEDFKEVAVQSQEAMIAAQDLDLVHRDLKPSNVMVSWLPSGRFQVKIVDFGLAKFSAKPSLQTIDHGDAVFGSIFFMAPEQFERTPLDRRTDMYSLGAMYYYALAGEYPFNGDTAPQVMAAHLQNKVAPLAEVRPDLPPWVCDWVMWHIRRDMSDRPESARSALEHFLAHDSAHTFGVTTSQPLQAAAPIATGTVNTQASALSGNTAPQPILSPSGQLSPQTAAQNIVATSAGNLNPISGATAPIPASTQAAVEQVIEQPVEVAPVVYSKPKVPKNVLILIGVVLLALIIMLMVFVLGNRGNASIQRINELSKQVDTKKHNSVIINDQDMGLLLNGFLNTDADASNTCGDILARAQAEGGTFNVDEQIAKFFTKEKLPEDQRRAAFEKIIRYRAGVAKKRTSAFPLIVGWIEGNPDSESVSSAVEGIKSYANDNKDFSTLLKVGATSKNKELIDQLEIVLGEIINRSKIQEDLVNQVSQLFSKAKNSKNKQFLINLAASTGVKSALPLIRYGLTVNDAPTVNFTCIALKKCPNTSPIMTVSSIVKTTRGDNVVGSTLRRNGIAAIASMLNNAASNGKNIGPTDWTKLIDLANSDTEYKEILNILVYTTKPWAPDLVKKIGQQVDSREMKKQIENSLKTLEQKIQGG